MSMALSIHEFRHSLRPTVAICVTMLLVSCATPQTIYQPESSPVSALSLRDAVNDATNAGSEILAYGSWTHDAYPFSRFVISQDGKNTTAYYDSGRKSCTEPIAFWLGGNTRNQGEVYYDTLPVGLLSSDKSHPYCVNTAPYNTFSSCTFQIICWSSEQQAARFVNAMLTIEGSAGVMFPQKLASSQLLPVNFAADSTNQMAPQARTANVQQYAAQAQEAVQAGRTDDAVNLYKQAVSANPDWAVGHYNLAELLATRHEYARAIEQMNIYLVLSPNATNKHSAQRQVVEWQSQTTQ